MARTHLAALVVLLVPSLAAAQPLEPRSDLAPLFDRVRDGPDPAGAIAALSAADDVAPYLRAELRRAIERPHIQALEAILGSIEGRARQRNKRRFEAWLRGRRFDLCAEALIACPDDAGALELVDQAAAALRDLAADASKQFGVAPERGPWAHLPSDFRRAKSLLHYAGDAASLPPGTPISNYFVVRANTASLGLSELPRCFLASRNGITYSQPHSGMNEWMFSFAVVNRSMPIRGAWHSLFVCDGDVELRDNWRNSCLLIANGDVYLNSGSLENSLVCAAGRIVLRSRRDLDGNLLFAGGEITAGGQPVGPRDASAHQRVLPFGVHFLDLREFGLELTVRGAVVRVESLAADSTLARQGLRADDVILSIDNVAPHSAADVRQALRMGIVRESVVVRVRRAGANVICVVYLDGAPLPAAPAPRPVAPR